VQHSRLFLFGAVGGAVVDQIHVRSGVLTYRTPRLAGQAWWVGPQFGVAAFPILESARVAGRRTPEPSPRTLVSGGAWFLGAYLASGVFRRRPRLLASAFIVTWLARMVRRRDDRLAVGIYALLLAAAGTAIESGWSSTGSFTYADPDVAGVPLWLPGLYVHGAPLAVDVARKLH
jgi:hypothetical protein